MADTDQQSKRRGLVVALVLGVLALGLGAMLLTGLWQGNDTEDTIQKPEEANQDSSQVFHGATPGSAA